jgi:twinkle protein
LNRDTDCMDDGSEGADPIEVHQPCKDCGSSDALSIYPDHTYCFSCTARHWTGNTTMTNKTATLPKNPTVFSDVVAKFNSEKLQYGAIKDRNISIDSCKKYNVKLGKANGKDCHVYPYYDKDGTHIINKVRIVETKEFFQEGERGHKTALFGQNLFKEGGKYITITEGEIDALSAYQMMGSKWPVVSIRNGAASAATDIKFNLDYLNTFDYVVICFDNDEPGRKASKDVANLFEPGTCKVMKPSLKDANEYLKSGQSEKFMREFWDAKTYTPEGILLGDDIHDLLFTDQVIECYPYPWDAMNELTYGMRKGELALFTAGTGIGKSSVMRELVHYLLTNQEERVGCLFLEESVRKTGDGILSVQANRKFHIPHSMGGEWTVEEKEKAYADLGGLSRAVFWDHFGATNLDNLMNRVRYMAKGLDCKYVILDHISIVIINETDERKAIDMVMLKLRTLVQELGIHLMVVCHLSRPSGTAHEEGASISLKELRGSHSLAQIPDMIFALERNSQAVDEEERNRTLIRVLKNRFSGETGPACMLKWDKPTGRLTEVPIGDSLDDNGTGDIFDDREFD